MLQVSLLPYQVWETAKITNLWEMTSSATCHSHKYCLSVCSWGSGTGGCPRQAVSLGYWRPEILLVPHEAQSGAGETQGQTSAAQCFQKERCFQTACSECLWRHNNTMLDWLVKKCIQLSSLRNHYTTELNWNWLINNDSAWSPPMINIINNINKSHKEESGLVHGAVAADSLVLSVSAENMIGCD